VLQNPVKNEIPKVLTDVLVALIEYNEAGGLSLAGKHISSFLEVFVRSSLDRVDLVGSAAPG
jgi:hypothetical protein